MLNKNKRLKNFKNNKKHIKFNEFYSLLKI